MTLTEGNKIANGRTEMLYNGLLVAIRQTNGVLAEPCKRCGGSGHYSYNPMDGTVCYGCNGRGIGDTTTEAEVIRKAENRAKAAARRQAKADREYAAKVAAMDTWKAANAPLVAALAPYEVPTDEHGYVAAEGWNGPRNTFLADLASQLRGVRPLSDRQVGAAWAAIKRQEEQDAAKAVKAAEQAAAGHYGMVGAKVNVTVEITFVKFLESERWDRSHSYLIKMITDQGHVLTTFSSGAFGREAEAGQRVTIKGIVKAHGEYNGAPETTLTRVAKLG